jgi:hypothetical protein
MTRIRAVEPAPLGIRVNAIAPGPVETPMAAKWHDAATREEWIRTIPLNRHGEVSEIAGTALFFLDDARSGYMTGQRIAVDGGHDRGTSGPSPTRRHARGKRQDRHPERSTGPRNVPAPGAGRNCDQRAW